jgi:predicted rRNA methylase YqxC with S4 and FtsJ domains
VVHAFARAGCFLNGQVESPILGAKGNREFLLWFRVSKPTNP